MRLEPISFRAAEIWSGTLPMSWGASRERQKRMSAFSPFTSVL